MASDAPEPLDLSDLDPRRFPPDRATWEGIYAQLDDLIVLFNGLDRHFGLTAAWREGDPPLTGARVLEIVVTAHEDAETQAAGYRLAWEDARAEVTRLRAALSAIADTRPRWRHVKRGTAYKEVGRAELQAGAGVIEGATLVIYQGDDGRLWAREEGEFEDGRFERVDDGNAP